MKVYFAPMEGITSYIYRNAHHKYFGGVDKYYTPFVSPGYKWKISSKDKREINPDNNEGTPVVPQILTNKAILFSGFTKKLADMGYEEVNFNLGCPSKTVVGRARGSGFLVDPAALDAFFAEVFDDLSGTNVKISVKTRLGLNNPEEFERILEVYNKYPICELTVHPRIQQDFYKKTIRPEWFAYAMEHTDIPLCYNGNLIQKKQYDDLVAMYPTLDAVMVARGGLINPSLPNHFLKGEELDRDTFLHFHQEICDGYLSWNNGDTNVLYKMKELWSYMGLMFEDSKKPLKKIKKAQKLTDYFDAVHNLVEHYEIGEGPRFL